MGLMEFSALSVQRSSSKKKSTKQAKEPKPVSKPVSCECVSAPVQLQLFQMPNLKKQLPLEKEKY
ncbi:hypothetical protein L484_023275 [Morus notabilis]|uniref:Uncharacterized protein n=1 Tax=Morus notabilis TaxID=981085 RepID=W9RNJ1_9ROSA|nr:hypothetical protein L484_023275 [Morus notabilis]